MYEEAIAKQYNNVMLEIRLVLGYTNEKKIGISEDGDSFHIGYRDLFYTIEKSGNKIVATTSSLEKIVRTIGNIPISILGMCTGKILLHCSSVMLNNSLYVFMGPKGTGKSTIAYKLIHYKGAVPFSDDALLVCEDKVYSRGNDFKVLCTDYYDKIEYFNKFSFNYTDEVVGKVHLKTDLIIDRPIERSNIDTIFMLRRVENGDYLQHQILNEYEKKIMLLNNVVGMKKIDNYYLEYSKISQTISELAHHVKIKILNIPTEDFDNSIISKVCI